QTERSMKRARLCEKRFSHTFPSERQLKWRRLWERNMSKIEVASALKAPFAKRYENFINGAWRAPASGKYFDNISPITGTTVCEIARSDANDIEAALDAAHAAKDAWARTSPAERANIMNK